jgi:hypothetical protein
MSRTNSRSGGELESSASPVKSACRRLTVKSIDKQIPRRSTTHPTTTPGIKSAEVPIAKSDVDGSWTKIGGGGIKGETKSLDPENAVG